MSWSRAKREDLAAGKETEQGRTLGRSLRLRRRNIVGVLHVTHHGRVVNL